MPEHEFTPPELEVKPKDRIEVVAFFIGQGGQHARMIDGFDEHDDTRELMAEVAEMLGRDPGELIRDERLLATSAGTQMATTLAAGGLARMAQRVREFDIVKGHSAGEYAAIAASGAMRISDSVMHALNRGKAADGVMDQVGGEPDGMAALLGARLEDVSELIDRIPDAYIANINTKKQIIVSGTAVALDSLKNVVGGIKAKYYRLGIKGGFHSPLVERAGSQFAEYLDGIKLKYPNIPILSPTSPAGALWLRRPNDIKQMLKAQFERGVDNVAADQELVISAAKRGVEKLVIVQPGPDLGDAPGSERSTPQHKGVLLNMLPQNVAAITDQQLDQAGVTRDDLPEIFYYRVSHPDHVEGLRAYIAEIESS